MPENDHLSITAKHIAALTNQLQELPHDTTAARILADYLKNEFPNTVSRRDFLTTLNVLVRPKVTQDEALEHGFLQADEPGEFIIQGDIITTDSAYTLGVRREGGVKYAIANSSCDLSGDAGRVDKGSGVLFAVQPVFSINPAAVSIIGQLVGMKNNSRMFLPAFQDDDPNVSCNYIDFAAPATASFQNILNATRHASLTALGWQIFASLHRRWFTREPEFERKMRG
jgi:hypothetical protein